MNRVIYFGSTSMDPSSELTSEKLEGQTTATDLLY